MLGHFDRCIDKRGFNYLEQIFKDISTAMGCKDPIAAIDTFEKMMQEMELTNPVSNNKEVDLRILSTSVNPVRLKNNPVGIDEAEAYKLYQLIVN
jgi:hypothetical protein